MKARIAAAAVAAIASLASFATVTSAAGLTPTTAAMPEGHAHAIGPRDPYTDGGKASRFDVYADTANVTDRRDPYTDGAHGIRERDPYTDGAHGSAGMNLAGLDRTGVSAPPAHSA
ncbi:MAG TPA: hypothetical protein DC084_18225 [Cupriavidus sp.]|nr:hypothetical protein [Cupriavidus sp.]